MTRNAPHLVTKRRVGCLSRSHTPGRPVLLLTPEQADAGKHACADETALKQFLCDAKMEQWAESLTEGAHTVRAL